MEDWKLQVSYKTPAGDMINIRANTADELSVLLEGIGDYSVQVAAVQRLVVGAYNTAPLGTQPSTQSTPPSTYSAPPQAQTPSFTPSKRNHATGNSEPDLYTRSKNLPTGDKQDIWEALRFLGMSDTSRNT